MKRPALALAFLAFEDGEALLKNKVQTYPDSPFDFGEVTAAADGQPAQPWTLVVLHPESVPKVANDPDVCLLPEGAYSTAISDLNPAQAAAMWAEIERRGIDIDHASIRGTDPYGLVVERLGRLLSPNFSLLAFPL
jgi:hypothetical protein